MADGAFMEIWLLLKWIFPISFYGFCQKISQIKSSVYLFFEFQKRPKSIYTQVCAVLVKMLWHYDILYFKKSHIMRNSHN